MQKFNFRTASPFPSAHSSPKRRAAVVQKLLQRRAEAANERSQSQVSILKIGRAMASQKTNTRLKKSSMRAPNAMAHVNFSFTGRIGAPIMTRGSPRSICSARIWSINSSTRSISWRMSTHVNYERCESTPHASHCKHLSLADDCRNEVRKSSELLITMPSSATANKVFFRIWVSKFFE